jgi:hypothetical protein
MEVVQTYGKAKMLTEGVGALMSAKDYSRLAAIIFAIVALVQLVRAVSG